MQKGRKYLNVDDEAYQALEDERHQGESFGGVILRLFGENKSLRKQLKEKRLIEVAV